MFISRIEVDWAKARNPYDLHRAVWTLFPGQEKEPRKELDEERQGFLFRVEENHTGHKARLLVQSQTAPRIEGQGARSLGSREFDPQPSEGQQLEFLLTANPIKTITDQFSDTKPGKKPNKRGERKCRVPLLREEEQIAWLNGRLIDCAMVESVTVQPHPLLFFRDKRKNHGKLLTVTYQGLLRVTVPEILRSRLYNGIGPAKAFGCGLMLVRRV
ncbi:type I-E CRISPR-associated protein Cas6/Cse3/CasE [Methylococcus sp. EFPC2]|uniref:type I-E CRISPR-associated protein Cas6/Cse3/CasE n=1 Tax=Methylococcus sp. EFPC2 TaxID=2812648 RepID=UPI0019671612|nr:type I-E CRISPR-associated protein Cas6/Cse3/CasE [Methylococcus sp. EFPC2]QSA96792.1 type I-E CRISPR-associated protein Cas6/Cse3/CasE [Methylococcus sp. EFPC2]